MTNADIARVFDHIATMLEMEGANVFRVRAYREGARVIEHLAEPAAVLSQTEGRLREIKGIGKDLEGKIRDLATTGTTEVYRDLAKKYPLSLMELTELQGLGPKRVKLLFEKLNIRGREDLAQAARNGTLREVPGFGETVEKNILKSLAATEAAPTTRVVLHAAWRVGHELVDAIRKVRGVERVELAGSFRRRRETIGDLDMLVCGGDVEDVMTAFTSHAFVAEVLARGDTRSSVKLGNGLQVDLRLVPLESFGAAMLYFTGSKSHNIELRKIALEKDMSLNEYGLTRGETVVAARTEEDVYKALGMDWIPPELREAGDEIALARAGRLPVLVTEEDLRADLHMHTDRSDGAATLLEMVRASKERGYAYCAITDHSKALGMTRGFDAARVRQSVGEIEDVRRRVPGIEVLHGLEVDILADGALDMDDDTLELLDWVVVSLHSSLRQPHDVVTKRVLRALDHPSVCAMGHPSGRKIGEREGADLDWDRVFARAAERGVLMEINGQPDRVDLSDVNSRLAKQRGLSFVIDSDAHSTADLDFRRYGLFVARRAGLTRDDVLNTRAFGAFETWRKKQKSRPAATARADEDATKITKTAAVKTETKKSASRKVEKVAAASEKASAPKRAARSKRGSASTSRSRPKK